MTRAQICDCGHMKSEHGDRKIGSEYVVAGGDCSYEGCICKGFEFNHFEVKPTSNSVKVLKMASLNEQGRPYGT